MGTSNADDTTTELQKLNLTTIHPDLATSNFHFLPNLNKIYGDDTIQLIKNVKRTVRDWWRKDSVDFFQDDFRKHVHRSQKYIQLSDEYIEK